MNNEIQIFNHEEFGEIRTIMIDGQIYFVGTDVARALGYKNIRNAVPKHVDDEDKLSAQIEYAGQKRTVTVINESGLYSLVLASKLQGAKKFKRWVTSEVLPTIRKTGSYNANPTPPQIAYHNTYNIENHITNNLYIPEDKPKKSRPSVKRGYYKMNKIEVLKPYLADYVSKYTKHRKNGFYDCPFCGSGTGSNHTPAFSLYEDNTKFKCFSCNAQGSIIDFYLMTHQMSNTPDNVAQAVRELAQEYHISDEEQPQPQKKSKIGQRKHVYFNADGSEFGTKLVNLYDDGSKNAFWYLPNSQKAGLNGQIAPLYHADALRAYPEINPVYVVEGEKDADTLGNYQILATTVPNGAGFRQWHDIYNNDLQDRDIIIITDNDEAGEKYGQTVAQNLSKIAKSVKIIPSKAIWKDCPHKGDISDMIQAIGFENTMQALQEISQNTANYQQSEIILPIANSYQVSKLSEVSDMPMQFAWFPYLPLGEITLIYARGGTGKSFLTCGICAYITSGRSLPEYNSQTHTLPPENVMIISAEDNRATLKQRISNAGGNLDRCLVVAPPETPEELENYQPFELPLDKNDTVRIQMLKDLLATHRPKLLIIDPWSAYIGQNTDMNRANSVRAVTAVLSVIAKEFQVAVIVVAHTNKKLQTESAADAISGSADLVNSA